MNRTKLLLIVVMVSIVGCRPRPGGPTPGGNDPSGGDPVLGAVQGVRAAAKRAVTQAEMHDLHLFIETASLASDRMPAKEFILETMKKENRKLSEMLQDGSIVLTGIQKREGVWAYEKDAPTKGGFILSQNGVERLSAEEVKQRLAGQ